MLSDEFLVKAWQKPGFFNNATSLFIAGNDLFFIFKN